MINEINKDLKGVAMVFDGGPFQILDFARNAQKGLSAGAPGRCGSLSDSSANRMLKADPEKLKKVQAMVEELNELKDFAPPSLKKRRRWSDIDGTLDIDRAFEGDSSMYRKSLKARTHGPTNVTLLANLDGLASDSSEAIFWRGAMAVALSSMLDDLGYSTTIWSWNVGYNVFKYPYDKQFTACLLKEAGSDLDPTNLMNCLTAWFMRNVMFATFAGGAHPCESIGGAEYSLGPWERYLDLEGSHVVKLPAVFNREDCIKQTLKELQRITKCSAV